MKDVILGSSHFCPLTGEFGIVYKAKLAEMGTPFLKSVAVKTLKGYLISQGCEAGKEYCVNCIQQNACQSKLEKETTFGKCCFFLFFDQLIDQQID